MWFCTFLCKILESEWVCIMLCQSYEKVSPKNAYSSKHKMSVCVFMCCVVIECKQPPAANSITVLHEEIFIHNIHNARMTKCNFPACLFFCECFSIWVMLIADVLQLCIPNYILITQHWNSGRQQSLTKRLSLCRRALNVLAGSPPGTHVPQPIARTEQQTRPREARGVPLEDVWCCWTQSSPLCSS